MLLLLWFQLLQTQSGRLKATKEGVVDASRRRSRRGVHTLRKQKNSSLLCGGWILLLRLLDHSHHAWHGLTHGEAHVEGHHVGLHSCGGVAWLLSTLHHHMLLEERLLKHLDLLLLEDHDLLVNQVLLLWRELGGRGLSLAHSRTHHLRTWLSWLHQREHVHVVAQHGLRGVDGGRLLCCSSL